MLELRATTECYGKGCWLNQVLVVKPFFCEVCKQSFLAKNSLKQHKATQNTCNVCEKSFITKRSLKRHKAKHNTEKAFSCDFCQKSKMFLFRIQKLNVLSQIHKNLYTSWNFHHITVSKYIPFKNCKKNDNNLEIKM